jgi:hypothetical protein
MKMTKLHPALTAIWFLATLAAAENGTPVLGDRHIEPAGGFSFAAPQGWQFKDFPGMKFQLAFGPAENDFPPNINVVDENFSGNLEAYEKANEQSLPKFFKDFNILDRAEFKTTDGNLVMKLATANEQNGKKLRQLFFFLDGPPGKKLVTTCTTSAESGSKFDKLFEASVRSFKLEKTGK